MHATNYLKSMYLDLAYSVHFDYSRGVMVQVALKKFFAQPTSNTHSHNQLQRPEYLFHPRAVDYVFEAVHCEVVVVPCTNCLQLPHELATLSGGEKYCTFINIKISINE